LVHADEACLLQSFLVKFTPNDSDIGEVKGQVSVFSMRKHEASGASFRVDLQTPEFYTKHFAHGFLNLYFFGLVEGGQGFRSYKKFKAKQLSDWKHQVLLDDTFVPYALLAKKADTIKLTLKASLYLSGLNNTLFYTGYPTRQSRRVMKRVITTKIVLPPMHSFKIRPVFLKLHKKQKKQQSIRRMVRLKVRIQKHNLYQTKWHTYRKKVRFGKGEQGTLKLVKDDRVIVEVINNSYPKQVLFSASVICTNEILRQKFWKLKDKYGNYLKIAVQKLTTKKDKFLHTNGKKETKTLGGRR
jgi:hypothetical protein